MIMSPYLCSRPKFTPDLSASSAVVASPGESELAGTDHTHGGAEVRDPDRSFRSQWRIVSRDFLRLYVKHEGNMLPSRFIFKFYVIGLKGALCHVALQQDFPSVWMRRAWS